MLVDAAVELVDIHRVNAVLKPIMLGLKAGDGRFVFLVMALALYAAVSTGQWDAENNPTPVEKSIETATQETRPVETIVVHQKPATHRQTHPSSAATAILVACIN